MTDPKRMLIVDDSKMSRMMISKIVKTHWPEWEILEAASGEEALAVAEGQDIDVMTLDMNMPGMDGVTLGVELRKRYPNAEISLVTANIQEAVRQKAREATMIFIPKPITEDRIAGYLNTVA